MKQEPIALWDTERGFNNVAFSPVGKWIATLEKAKTSKYVTFLQL